MNRYFLSAVGSVAVFYLIVTGGAKELSGS